MLLKYSVKLDCTFMLKVPVITDDTTLRKFLKIYILDKACVLSEELEN